MGEIELIGGKWYLFCIDGKWRIGECKAPLKSDIDQVYDFTTDHNITYYDEECSAIIPLSSAIRALELQTQLDDADKSNSQYAEQIQNLLDERYRLKGKIIRLQAENERLRESLSYLVECADYEVREKATAALEAAKGGV